MKKLWNKKPRWVSWFIRSKWFIITCRRIWVFFNKSIEIYKFDPAHFLLTLGLVRQACLQKTEVKLKLWTEIDMLLMVEKGIRCGICHAHRHATANNKYMKNYNKDKESSYLMYLYANNLYGPAMSQKLPVHGFKWKKILLNSIKILYKIIWWR